MQLTPIKLNAKKLMKDITVEVNLTGLRVWRVRLFFGVLLFRFAGFVIGCDLTINTGTEEDGPGWRDIVRDKIIPELNTKADPK